MRVRQNHGVEVMEVPGVFNRGEVGQAVVAGHPHPAIDQHAARTDLDNCTTRADLVATAEKSNVHGFTMFGES